MTVIQSEQTNNTYNIVVTKIESKEFSQKTVPSELKRKILDAAWFHMLDAGRAIQSMMIAAWGFGIASRLYGGMNKEQMAKDFNLPSNLNITAVAGFGYPAKPIKGRKDRKPLSEIVFQEKYDQPLSL